MTRFTTFTLVAGLGLALASSAQAQNYAPSVNYQAAPQQSSRFETNQSAFVATAPYRGQAPADSAPLGYEGAIPAGD